MKERRESILPYSTMNDEFDFQYLDPSGPVRLYRRRLPHWRQEGVLYFTTFRLADSIPAEVLRAWDDDRRRWLASHGLTAGLSQAQWNARYQQIPEGVRRAFEQEEARRFYIELDRCHGCCVFRNPEAAAILDAALHFYHGKKLHCGDFVIMPNHVHWVVAPYADRLIENLIGSVKRYSAVRINKLVGSAGTLWQQESFDHIVRDARELDRILDYIKNNPAKVRLRPGEYTYYKSDWLM